MSDPDALPHPSPRYRKIRRLGAGGYGVVWLARDDRLGRDVAIKYVHTLGEEEAARFRREAQLAARIRHPNVVQIYEVGRTHLVMQYVEGVQAGETELSFRQAADVVRQAAEGVGGAHALGIVHRDLKPANIVLSGNRAVVMDFGLARSAEGAGTTMSGTILGTPAYMSPEQASGRLRQIDARSDVYSLGATLYHLLAGRPPFVGDSPLHVIQLSLAETPPAPSTFRSGIDPDLEGIVARAMAKDPAARYAGGSELARDLARWLAGGKPRLRRPTRPSRPPLPLRKRPGLVAPAVAAVALIGTLAAFALRTEPAPGSDGPDPARELVGAAREVLAEAELLARAPDPDAKRLRAMQEEARRLAGSALAVDSRNTEGLRLRAEASAALGDLEAAASDLGAAIDLDDGPALRLARAWTLARLYDRRRELPWPVSLGGGLEAIHRPVEGPGSAELRRRIEDDLAAAGAPDDPRTKLARAVLFLGRGEAAAAAAILEEAVAANPADPDPWFHRALARLSLQDLPAAIEDLDRCLAIRPASPRPLQALALCQFARADWGACRDLLQRAAALGADTVPIRRLTAAVDAAQGRYEEAFGAFEEMGDPADGVTALLNYLARRAALEPRVELGWAATCFPPGAGVALEAGRVLEPALDSPSCPALVHAYRGLDLIALGRLAEAETSLARAIEGDPSLALPRFWAIVPALARGDWQTAAQRLVAFLGAPGRAEEIQGGLLEAALAHAGGEACLERMHAAADAPGGPHFAPSFLLVYLEGDMERAAVEAAASTTDPALRHALAGLVALDRRDFAALERETAALLQLDPKTPHVLRLLLVLDGTERRAEHLERLLALDPADPKLLLERAEMFVAKGDYEAAVEILRRNSYAYAPKGTAHELLGELAVWDPDGASRWEETLRLASNPVALWYGLARARLLRGDFAGAVEASDRALERDPEWAYAREIRGRARLATRRELPGALADAEAAASRLWTRRSGLELLAACRWAVGDREGAALALESSGSETAGRAIRARLAGGAWRLARGDDLYHLFQTLLGAHDLAELEAAASAARTIDSPIARATAATYLARAHELGGRRAETLASLTEVVRSPHGQSLLDLMAARMYVDAGAAGEALEILEPLAAQRSDLAGVHWHLARARLGSGDRAGAARALEAYRADAPSDPWTLLGGAPPSRAEFERLVRDVGR